MKSWLGKNDTKTYLTYNEEITAVTERFLRTLKNKVCKYMTSISKILFTEKLDDIVNKYNNAYHRTIKMKPNDVKPSRHIDSKKEINDKDPKFEIGNIITTWDYTNIFAKGYVPNWTEQVFVIKNLTLSKITLPWTYVISDLNGKEIFRMFYEKELQNTNQKEFRVEKVIKRIGGNYMLNGRAAITLLTVGLTKST